MSHSKQVLNLSILFFFSNFLRRKVYTQKQNAIEVQIHKNSRPPTHHHSFFRKYVPPFFNTIMDTANTHNTISGHHKESSTNQCNNRHRYHPQHNQREHAALCYARSSINHNRVTWRRISHNRCRLSTIWTHS